MMKFLRKIWSAITSVFNIYIGINSAVSLVLIAAAIYYFFLKDILVVSVNMFSTWYDSNSVWHSLVLGIVASITAAIVFGILGVFLFAWSNKMRLTGEYNAFEIDSTGKENKWGKVTIKYHPLSTSNNHPPMKLRLKHDKIIMEGSGMIIDNRYLVGHYCETGEPARRRSGAFMFEISGAGNTWEGRFVYIDPETNSPAEGKAKWIKSQNASTD